MQAIRIIHDEHRAIAAILHGMLYLIREIRDRGAKPNFDLFGAMIYYIDAFPERLHHPKEDMYLFRVLRTRHPDSCRCSTGWRKSIGPTPRCARAGAGALPARRCLGIPGFRQGSGRLCGISLEPHAR
jgi:hypothetical protein